jgi:4-hydroxy-tetrahydrodipicolinate synthase
MFFGSIPALITPFAGGEVDDAAFQRLVEWQIAQGSSAVSPCGTTGEAPTLSHGEFERVIRLCVEAVAGRVPVIAGTGSNSTGEAISLTRSAEAGGVDAALIVTPYYNKPTQEGVYRHYKEIHDAVGLPIVIYNIPGRSVIDMSAETMARLAALPRIVGVKDATGDLGRPARLRQAVGPDFCQLSGEDLTLPGFLAQGGHGCISVVANVAPAACAALHDAWRAGDMAAFAKWRDLLTPLNIALSQETNPAPIKYAASLLGHCEPSVRLPLVEISAQTRKGIESAMARAGLIGRL